MQVVEERTGERYHVITQPAILKLKDGSVYPLLKEVIKALLHHLFLVCRLDQLQARRYFQVASLSRNHSLDFSGILFYFMSFSSLLSSHLWLMCPVIPHVFIRLSQFVFLFLAVAFAELKSSSPFVLHSRVLLRSNLYMKAFTSLFPS